MIHIFDLDLTIWETYDKHGNHIWAKQLVFPLSLNGSDKIIDDVGSSCSLKPGIRAYLDALKARGCSIGYLSVGRHWNLEDSFQPSLKLIDLFGLNDYFNHLKILGYKTSKKSSYLEDVASEIIFYDDDDHVIADLASLKHVQVIDAKTILDWKDLIKND